MSGRRLAVLVGVDEYPHLRPNEQLQGCVNDVELMAATLTGRFGFRAEDIVMLRNAEASRDGILAAFERLAADAGPEDVVVVHFSGHGSQMTDREGDEGDGLDETIVPADSGRAPADNRDITDDEIHDWLTRLTSRTPLVTLVFDCCHSGTVTRDLGAARVRRIEPDRRPPSELPPSPVARRGSARDAGPSGWLPPARRYTLLAGCRDEELSHEHEQPDAPTHGALTWFLVRSLALAPPGATYRDVFEPAALGVTRLYPSQRPQIEGAVDREVFGVAEARPAPFVPVVRRDGAVVTLGGGLAQGVEPESRWEVRADGGRLGLLRVTAAGAATAGAAIEEEAQAGAIAAGARAFAAGRSPSAPPLTVALGAEPAGLAELLDSADELERVGEDEPADARVRVVGPRDAVAGGEPVPQLGALAEAVVAVTGRDGRLLLPSLPAAGAGTPEHVRDDLVTIAHNRRVLALDSPGGPLEGRVELTLLRRAADGTWVPAEPEVAGGEVVYEVGEPIGLRIASLHDAPLYPAVLDLGLAYAVNVAHPYAGKEELRPGGTVEIGTREGEELPLGFPAEFPFGGDADDTDSGIETVKLLVTAEPADYTALLQAGITRDFAGRPPEPPAWGAVTRGFRLRRATKAVDLSPGGETVKAGGIELTTPGLDGRVTALGAGGGGRTRSRELSTDALEGALAAEGLDVQAALELEVAAAATRALRGDGPPAVELRPPPPSPGEGQLVLVTDEAGVLTWHFATAPATRGLDEAGPATARPTYRLERRVLVDPVAEPGTRGLVGAIGKKLIKVLVFPLVEPAIGEVADFFAGRWEAKKRPYRLRRSRPEDFATPGGADVGAADWDELSGKRTLLLVHGTFSRSHSGFGGLPRDAFEELYRRYDGRVLALDHFTLSHTPRQNVDWLIAQLPDGRALDVDILCHSRGGLVSRTLAEHQSELSLGSKQVRVRDIVFVATPNAGTALADGEHVGDLLDTYTNVLNFFPDNGVTEVFEGIVMVAKLVATGALGGLDGLTSMVPGGEFQGWLNQGSAPDGTRYRALAANHEPTIPGFAGFAKDWVMDTVFSKLENDLVVPTDGVYADNGAGLFPIDERHVFDAGDGVVHTNFFEHPTTRAKLLGWLGT